MTAVDEGTRGLMRVLARGGEWTRQDLAAETGWARNTVVQRIEALSESGWLREDQRIAGRGRPSSVVSLDPTSRLVFVASFGLTHLTCAITDLFGETIEHHTQDVTIEVGPERALAGVQRALQVLLARHGFERSRVGAVVIGLPSPIDPATGRAKNPSGMPGWVEVSVASYFGDGLGLPVIVENDANLLAIGARAMHAPGSDNIVFVKVGVGIGAGAIVGGRLVRGQRGLAGEIGHLPIERGRGQKCGCGNMGCVGMFAGTEALIAELQAKDPSVTSVADLERLAAAADPACLAALRQADRDVAEVVVPAVAILSPETLVFGGRIVGLGDQFLSGVRETLYAKSLPALTADLRVEIARDYERLPLRGAAELALDHLIEA